MTVDLVKEAHLQIEWNWVKGHQDDNVDYDELPFEAQLNVQCNNLAETAHYFFPYSAPTYTTTLPTSIYIQGKLMSDMNMRTVLYFYAHGPALIEYMKQKYNWSDDVLNEIDWEYFFYCYGKKPIHKMTNIVKFIHEWQYTNTKKVQISFPKKPKPIPSGNKIMYCK